MLDRILAAKWALEATFHDRMFAMAMRRMERGMTPFDVSEDKPSPYLVDVPTVQASNGFKNLGRAEMKSGQVLVMPMIGAISRYGDWCSYGAEDYAAWIQEMNQTPSISAGVLAMNGPGGEVDGIEMLGEVIKHSQKPIVTHVAGWAASAHYWLASQSREIIMESETTSSVGSIGVLSMHIDYSAFYEKEGVKVKIIRSDGSDQKARFNSVEPLTPDLEAEIRAELTVIRGTFISKVQGGRPKITDAIDKPNGVFSGRMFNGKEAIKNGMADRIGYLGDAVYRADLLARKQAA